MVKARRWCKLLGEGELDVTAVVAREGVQSSYITRLVRLTFLLPEFMTAALKGQLRACVDAETLIATVGIEQTWLAQATTLLRR